MSKRSKGFGWTFWLTVALVVSPLLYLAGYGIWIWFQFCVIPPFEVVEAGNSFFLPAEDAAMNGPDWLMEPYRAYLSRCSQMGGGPELAY